MVNDTIKKYEFKEGLPQEFEILSLSQLLKGFKAEMMSPHRTEFYHVFWFQKGAPTHLVDFKPVNIEPNSFLYLNKNVVQRFDHQKDFDGKVILFTDSFFCQTDADTKFLRSSILFHDLLSVSQFKVPENTFLFEQLFSLMEGELSQGKDVFQSDILRNYLRNLFLHSEREIRKQNFTELEKSTELDLVITFKDLLEQQFHQHKSVSYFARKLNITEKRFNQATSKILGNTPKQMINERVLLEAKRLLAHTNKSVKEIGFELGFEISTNFIKYFRKQTHVTPLEFRDNFNS